MTISSPEALLSATLACAVCGRPQWAAEGGQSARALRCGTCGASLRFRDGILQAQSTMHPEAQREQAAVLETETDQSLGGWREGLGQAEPEGGLLQAYLSLPYGDGSFRFAEPGYFANVQHFADEFNFVLAQLGERISTGRLLDVGADGTWSTARFAARGYSCVALDITDHLRLAKSYHSAYPGYALVNADMHAPVFVDGAFDVVTAINALHHSSRLPELAANLARVLRPGGCLGIIEPYVQNEAQQASFGASQSACGINENVYTLDRWCEVFADVGLHLETYALSDSFNAVFKKTSAGVPRYRFEDRFDEAFYRSELTVAPTDATIDGSSVAFAVTVHNRGHAGWATKGPSPLGLSYHISGRGGAAAGTSQFDNARTPIAGFLSPGQQRTFDIIVTLPTPGQYDVEFDLVHEGVTWFKDRGGRVAVAQVTVVDR